MSNHPSYNLRSPSRVIDIHRRDNHFNRRTGKPTREIRMDLNDEDHYMEWVEITGGFDPPVDDDEDNESYSKSGYRRIPRMRGMIGMIKGVNETKKEVHVYVKHPKHGFVHVYLPGDWVELTDKRPDWIKE